MGSKPNSLDKMLLSKRKEFLKVITLRSPIPRDIAFGSAEQGSVMVLNLRVPGTLMTRYRLSNESHNRILYVFPDNIALRSLNGINRGNREVVNLGNGRSGSRSLGPLILSLLIAFSTAR